jgi:N-acetylneuraminate synthase
MRGEVLLKAIQKDSPLSIDDIDSPYSQVPSLRQTIYNRGLSIEPKT